MVSPNALRPIKEGHHGVPKCHSAPRPRLDGHHGVPEHCSVPKPKDEGHHGVPKRCSVPRSKGETAVMSPKPRRKVSQCPQTHKGRPPWCPQA